MSSTLLFGQAELESKKIIEEIMAITEKYNQTWGTVDMNKVAGFHSDSSFRYYRNMKLAISSNEDFRKLMPQYFTGIKTWRIEVIDPVVQVLSDNAAVIGFTGKAELITNEGTITDSGSGAYTYVWQKNNGQWKLVHIHESVTK